MKAICIRHKTAICLVFSGLLTGLTIVCPRLGFLQWFSLVPAALMLFACAREEKIGLKRVYWMGILCFWAYYAVALHWFFYMYPLDFAGLSNLASLFVVLIACFGLSFLQAVFSALVFVIITLLLRCELLKKHFISAPFVCAAVWVVAEWFQTVGWWGVPWGRLPLGQIESPLLLRSAALFGSYFITFVIVAVNFCLASVFSHKEKKRVLISLALVLFSVNLAAGTAVTLLYREDGETDLTVAAIQGNISSNDKWDLAMLEKTLSIYESLTVAAAANGAEVVVWPETALPYVVSQEPKLIDYLSRLAKENEVTILVSAFTESESGQGLSNSLIEVRPDGSFGDVVYSKRRLVPFGEFVPMRDLVMLLFPPLANIGMLEEDLVAGEESVVIETDKGAFGCGICFDSIYETVIRESVQNGAEIIAVSTNDSWFGDSAALKMHHSQSVLRAIETGRYVVRSANTGISSVIDPLGNVIDDVAPLREGYAISQVNLRKEITLYTKIGNLWVLLCVAWILGVYFLPDLINKMNIKSVTKK